MSHLGRLVARWPGHPPWIDVDGTRVGGDELLDRIRRAAGWMQRHGLIEGHRVALQTPKELAFLEVHLAALALGVSTLPINPRHTAREVAQLLDDARPELVVRGEPGSGEVAAHDLRAALDAAAAIPLPGIDGGPAPGDDAEALLCYTSGTTGRPKGARIRHRHLTATVSALHDAWQVTPDDVLLHVLPLFHIHGLVVAQHVALWGGAGTAWCPPDAEEIVARLARGGTTILMAVPTIHHRLLAVRGPRPHTDLRLVTSGSAPLPAATHTALTGRLGTEVVERYGMTEVGIVLSNPYDGARVPGSVGRPLPGVELRIVDPDTGRDLPDGEIGELLIRGPSVFDGYLGLPEASAAALEGGWMHTGDLGHRRTDGYVFLAGRRGDMLICGGFNVYPAEVEGVLASHPDVAEAAVVGVPHSDLGEVVAATVVPADGPIDRAALDAFARERLAAYKVPRHVDVQPSLPRNAMGKVQRDTLRRTWTRTLDRT